MQHKISVIVPVYNTREYLPRCIDSLLAQTYENLEIVLVDDGSPDGAGVVCDSYRQKAAEGASGKQIVVIHQENKGLNSAWKAGVSAATGEYVGFVDSDDFVDPDMYQRMQEASQNGLVDMVCCGLRHEYQQKNHKEWKEEVNFPKDYYTFQEMQDEIFPILINDGSFMGRSFQPNRVTKLVKRALVMEYMEQCRNDVTVGEDFQFSLVMLMHVKNLAIIRDFYPYVYWMNEHSMTGSFDTGYLEKITLLKERLQDITREAGYDFTTQIWNDFMCLCVLYTKGEVYLNKNLSYRQHRENLKRICRNSQVREAIKKHNMQKITVFEKLFIFFMKHQLYLAIYGAVRLYFR